MTIRIPELFAHSTKGKKALGDALLSSVLVSEEAENRLIERLRELAPDRQWAENYLELARELVELSGLGNDDPRLAMTIPKHRVELPVNINKRYILFAYYHPIEDIPAIQLILPASMRERVASHPAFIDYGYQFIATYRGEAEAGAPFLADFGSVSRSDLGEELLNCWREALLTECDHAKGSLYRRYHEPVVYRAVTDIEYQRRLLDIAFPKEGKDGRSMGHTLKIDWKDNTTGSKGGTDLTIKVDGKTTTDKHYSKDDIDDALKAVEEAVKKVKFDNRPDTRGTV